MSNLTEQLKTILETPTYSGVYFKHNVTGELVKPEDFELDKASNYSKVIITEEDLAIQLISSLTGEEVISKSEKVGKSGVRNVIRIEPEPFELYLKAATLLLPYVHPVSKSSVFKKLGFKIEPSI